MVDLIERLRNRAEQTSDYPKETLYSEAADELTALRERVAELEGYVRHKSNCARQPETLHRFACTCGLSAILAKQGGEA